MAGEVAKSLRDQTKAINALARELKTQQQQVTAAVHAKDQRRAEAIAKQVQQNTDKLVELTTALEQSNPDAGPGQELPGGSGGSPDQSLPGNQPGAGQELPEGRPERPDQSLPGSGARPDAGGPGEQPEGGQELPTTPPPTGGQPLPPTATPKA